MVLILSSVIPLFGLWRVLAISALLCLCLAPYPLAILESDKLHFGIAEGLYVPKTYSVVLAVLALASLRQRGFRKATAFGLVFIGYVLLGSALEWNATPALWSGVVHLTTAVVALGVGISIGQAIRTDVQFARLWAVACLGIVVVQGVFSVGQLLGLPLSVYSEVGYFNAESRAIGTFNHPSVLGKVFLLLLVAMLPLTRSNDLVVRRVIWVATLLSIPVLAATQARANLLAVLAAVFLWIILDTRLTSRRRMVYASISFLASIPVLLVLVPRFLMDPEGGDRPNLLKTGLAQIARSPWFGIGPNSYSDVVGGRDLLAATGFPVHNTLLLAVAELGVVGAVLLFSPIALQLVLAVKGLRLGGPGRDGAMAVLVTAPGLALVAMTGWGMLADGVLILWFLVVGISLSFMRSPRRLFDAPSAVSYLSRRQVRLRSRAVRPAKVSR